jgi:NAD(P)-dependent dehydrogenase (short-subunit alcohol dehydrogenase family)
MKELKDKVAFITGGASGIGLGIAKACAKYGMKVLIVDMRPEALGEAMKYFKEKNLPAHPINLNITNREAYVKAADEAEKVFGKIHVLVNNAGVGGSSEGPVEEATFKDWDYSVSVNIGGVINGVVTILPRILKHGEGGHIVSTSSTLGIAASGGSVCYCMTKFAVAGMMESLATDLQDKNVGVSVLLPGPVRTNLGQSSFENRPAQLRNEGETWPPKPPPMFDEMMKIFMDPVETGERVVRGIRNNDLFIHTHPEFREAFIARHEAIMRAIPDEPRDERRVKIARNLGTIYRNDIYDKQQPVGPPDWT